MWRLAKFRLPRISGRTWYANKVTSNEHALEKGDNPARYVLKYPISRYGGEDCVTLITGDNIFGRQGSYFIKTLIEHAKVPLTFERILMGEENTYASEFITSVYRNRNAVLVDLSYDPVQKTKTMLLNNTLNLFACSCKMECTEGYCCRFPGLKLAVVVQNNTGDYSKLEYDPVPGMVETLRISQRTDMERFLTVAFDYALENDHSNMALAHKKSWLPLSDGYFVDMACEMADKEKYKGIKLSIYDLDRMVQTLVENPYEFDLICSSERYGTTLMAIAAAVCGGFGLFSSKEFSKHHAIFKPLQTRLSLTDRKELSPYGIVRACIDLLYHLGNVKCASIMEEELRDTMANSGVKTKEYGGEDSGEFLICNIVNRLKCDFGSN